MYQFIIGTVDLRGMPPKEAVTVSGGGREISEGVTLEGRVIATRPPRAGALRVQVSAPTTYGLPKPLADALAALAASGEPFTVTLLGYELEGTFTNCLFDGPVRFPPISAGYSSYTFTLYVPQQEAP